MTNLELHKFTTDIEKLMEENKTHPGIILFQPRGSKRMYCIFMGSPSKEWISKAGTELMKRLEAQATMQIFKGTN